MAPRKSVAASKTAPMDATASKSGRQRKLTNKQQQLGMFSFFPLSFTYSALVLVSNQNEKDKAAKNWALVGAVRSEQQLEENIGFRKTYHPGNVHLVPLSSLLIFLFLTPRGLQ
jgi:hypothetical protein